MQLALHKLQPASLQAYASALRSLVRHLPLLSTSPLQQQLEFALAAYSDTVHPGRVWTAVSALCWAQRLHLLPPFDLDVCRAIARGVDASAPPVIGQLWFHPTDLHVLSTVDPDFDAAAHVSFDLMLRAGQLDLLQCGDLDYCTQSVWCPPHKGVRFPYLRKPSNSTWQKLVAVHANRPSNDRLFLRKSRVYSNLLGDLTEKALGVRLTWHTLRRGGATTRAHRGESAEAIGRFGCWGSEKAVTHYLFPWSDVPLRHWRPAQPHPSPTTTTRVTAPKPHPKHRRRTPSRPLHHLHGDCDGGPHPRPAASSAPSPL